MENLLNGIVAFLIGWTAAHIFREMMNRQDDRSKRERRW